MALMLFIYGSPLPIDSVVKAHPISRSPCERCGKPLSRHTSKSSYIARACADSLRAVSRQKSLSMSTLGGWNPQSVLVGRIRGGSKSRLKLVSS